MGVNMFGWFKKKDKDFPKYYRTECAHCGRTIKHRYFTQYNRGHNYLCEQAAGGPGVWCESCMRITWKEPDFAKWMKEQPHWIIPHEIRKFTEDQMFTRDVVLGKRHVRNYLIEMYKYAKGTEYEYC